MKASLKLRDEQNPLLRAKIPVSVLGLPFISGISTGDTNELCLHLRTACVTGPSLKISYRPNESYNPFSFAIKSGIGLWGSPENASLNMAAEFSLIGRSNPTFTFQIKPEFGDFMLKKTARSFSPVINPNQKGGVSETEDRKENGGIHQNGGFHNGVGGTTPQNLLAWKDWPDFQAVPTAGFREMLSGFAVMAKTKLPVRKHAAVKIRWGVNIPTDSQCFGGGIRREFGRNRLPFLTVDKISIENVEKRRNVGICSAGNYFPAKLHENAGSSDMEFVNGMCLLMKREIEVLHRENSLMKGSLEELRSGISARSVGGTGRENKNGGKNSPENEGPGDFEQWRKKKNGGGERRETQSSGFPSKPDNLPVDISEELQKAIKAASGV